MAFSSMTDEQQQWQRQLQQKTFQPQVRVQKQQLQHQQQQQQEQHEKQLRRLQKQQQQQQQQRQSKQQQQQQQRNTSGIADNANINTAATSTGTATGSNSNDNHLYSKRMSSMHMDYIHHIAFDIYGRRMATCGGDRFVRVWDLKDDGDWELVGEFQAHRGSVTMLAWAHPEFGALLATCGSDHDAKIWEEGRIATTASTNNTMPTSPMMMMNNAQCVPVPGLNSSSSGNNNNTARWTTKAQMTEARKAVSCLEFAPRHWGLRLATGSADGCVRIYEAVDIMNLSQWPIAATIQCFASSADGSNSLGVSCLSWCTGRFEPPTLVVGGSYCIIYRYSELTRSWQPVLQLTTTPASANVPNTGITSSIAAINTPITNNVILDVAWAPNVGRRFHYIAVAEDQQLRVFKLNRHGNKYNSSGGAASVASETAGGGSSNTGTLTNLSTSTLDNSDDGGHNSGSNNNTNVYKLEFESCQTLQANAWRCQWNLTGTVLASSGDGGIVQLWKSDFDGNFHCVSQTMGDLTQIYGQ